MRNIVILGIITLFFLGCSSNGDRKNKNLLPPASGRAGEIIVVMDSAQWKGPVGEEIRETFRAEVGGLPREEFMFKINHVDPRKLNDVLKSVKNLLFVMTVDDRGPGSKVVRNYFTKSSIDKIKNDPNLFVHTAEDEFARGQTVMYLFGQNKNQLLEKIKVNREKLQNFFNQAENKRLYAGLYQAKEEIGFNKMLKADHECSMRLPFAYKLVVNQPGFIWFRQINAESDKNIFVTYRPYTSEKAFDREAILSLRDSIASHQLFEDPAYPETFITTETKVPYVPVTTEKVSFNGKYAIKMTGLWKTNNLSMGGPFISYTLVDEELDRLYYIEGFLYSPGKNQREFMRELEVILSTFKTKDQLTASATN
ncbi:hypothetical protein C900_04707 [Fulvivirga imtechensis AK7]|uniref:DUF4837 domain-containing protein n=1 Tax=Fulvivirga imtechensis AK7 TaxID=1237149 RepID=L8JLP8_9BACT|nr:DUF4837 family protein [Fulvivirga imtechensis]ELR69730.1 hypothetical protein C900_04707 [Fulvivirga imtechensis AK7]